MTKNIALSRPAMSAIAAFMVLSTPSAFAQEAPTITMTPPVAAPAPQTPPTQTPPTVPEPTTPAPVAAPQTTQPTAQQPIIRVPLDIAPAEPAPAPKAAEQAAATPRAERTTPRPAPKAAPAAATPVAETPVAKTAPAEENIAAGTTVTAPAEVMLPAEPVIEAAPLPVQKAATESDFPWEIAGGAAALLIAGGVGLAFARRRKVEREHVEEDAYEPVAATGAPVATTAVASTASDAPMWVTPAYAPREPVAPARTTPAFAAAPSGSMGRHEAMAMAGPTPDNPFATLSKRLKRARFLDRQERVAYDETLSAQKDMTRKPVSAWEIAQRDVAPAPAEQEVRRPERGPARPGTLRPGFSRN